MSELAEVSMRIALTSAVEYLRVHDLTADPAALADCITSHVKAAIPAALHDARMAIEARMAHVANATFGASISLAGIEAAREAGQSRRVSV